MAQVTLLLPEALRLGGTVMPALGKALGRADRLPGGGFGPRAQLQRHFELAGGGWPAAAITRQRDVGDALSAMWLRADPAWVRAEMTGARLFGSGDRLGLSRQDVDALLPALQPLFADAGLALDAPDPGRWYVRLPLGGAVPSFVDPDEALGTDVFDHLPQGKADDASMARRWRALLNDAQVILHNHPRNARRVASGLPPINSLWFWGAGSYPARVSATHVCIHTDDALLHSLGASADVDVQPLPARWQPSMTRSLIDLRNSRDVDALAREWILPAIDTVASGTNDKVIMDFTDGSQFLMSRGQRWRIWRKPLRALHVPTMESQVPSP